MTVEYVVVLALVTVGVVFALIGLGAPLLQLYRFQQTVVLLPFP